MRYPARLTAFSITAMSFVAVSLLQASATHGAKLSESANLTEGGASRGIDRETFNGEWRVRCSERSFKNGGLLNSSQDSDDSLIVVETDKDGSYQLYRFPNGFGEAFPRLRRAASNQYTGQDTVNGIATLVKQEVDIQNEKIAIRQTTIDAPTNKTETDISCEGSRVQTTLRFPTAMSENSNCQTDPTNGERPDTKIASQ